METATKGDRPVKELLVVSWSTCEGSVSTAILSTAAQLCPAGWSAVVYEDITQLPHFNPDVENAGPAAMGGPAGRCGRGTDLHPEYGGAMPGALKNVLEWTIGDTVMYGTPVG